MALTSGTKLGPYEIHSAIGAGGMGEVYRARDTRLDRIVAIKVKWMLVGTISLVTILGIVTGSVRHAQAQAADQLYGTWRLVKYTRTIVATGETRDVFGK